MSYESDMRELERVADKVLQNLYCEKDQWEDLAYFYKRILEDLALNISGVDERLLKVHEFTQDEVDNFKRYAKLREEGKLYER